MLRVMAALAGLLIYIGDTTGMSASSVPTCTYDVTKTVVRQLNADSQLFDVIAYLRRTSIRFDLFSNRDQRIKASEIETFDYESAQPVKLIVGAEGVRQPNLVKETELLILVFGETKHITGISCETFYTGP